MRNLLKLFLLYFLIPIACISTNTEPGLKLKVQQSSPETIQTSNEQEKNNTSKKAVIDSDTLTLDTKAAVFFQPNSLQIEKRMKEVGEEDFRAGADDYMYYTNISSEFLESRGLEVFDAKNKSYLKFIMNDKKQEIIKIDTLDELWGIYLFDPNKKPHYANMAEIEEDYKNYFE